MARKRQSSYSPDQSLAPVAFSGDLEGVARELYELACCGSRKLWSTTTLNDFSTSRELHDKFYKLANDGMFRAQQIVIDGFARDGELRAGEECLYRSICDSIAWQFLGQQLCHARRIYKEAAQPNLRESNFSSVVMVANEIRERERLSMPLICDLTSFVQVGDIYLSEPGKGYKFIEVKDGKENSRISDLVQFYRQSGCERFRGFVEETESVKAVDQFNRVNRQLDRLNHVASIMNKGDSVDPDTGIRHVIPDPVVQIDMWDDKLNESIEKAGKDGWSVNVVDDCLFIGCYVEKHFLHGGHLIFNRWLDKYGGDEHSPRARIVDSMRIPLALPLFNRVLPAEAIFDLLFGRMQICMGISVPELLRKCSESGISVRFATRRERGLLEGRGGAGYVKADGKPVFVGLEGREIALMDGIFMRSLFHGQSPISIIRSHLENPVVVDE